MHTAFSALGKKFVFLFVSFLAAAIFALVLAPQTTPAQEQFSDSQKWEIGGHYAFLSLPSECTGGAACETSNNGLGANLTYDFSSYIGFDTEMDFFGNNGNAPTALAGGNVTEGLFGFRIGPTTRKWGLYSEVRPGFVNFSRVLEGGGATAALSGFASDGSFAAHFANGSTAPAVGSGSVPQFTAQLRYQASSNPLAVLGFTDATYFAFNYGEEIEYRPTKHAALRFDIGDTIVAYPGTTIGTPFRQHNFQISEAIVFRF